MRDSRVEAINTMSEFPGKLGARPYASEPLTDFHNQIRLNYSPSISHVPFAVARSQTDGFVHDHLLSLFRSS